MPKRNGLVHGLGMNADIHLISKEKKRRAVAGLDRFPALIARAGERAAFRFVEFFTANIRNKNTRKAYGHAVCQRSSENVVF